MGDFNEKLVVFRLEFLQVFLW